MPTVIKLDYWSHDLIHMDGGIYLAHLIHDFPEGVEVPLYRGDTLESELKQQNNKIKQNIE